MYSPQLRLPHIVGRYQLDGEESGSHHCRSNAGRYACYVLVGGPLEHEKTGSKNHGTNHHWWKPRFWESFVVIRRETAVIIALVEDIGDSTQDNTGQEREETQRAHNTVLPSFFLKYNWESCQVAVKDAIDGRGVKSHEKINRRHEHLECPDPKFQRHLLYRYIHPQFRGSNCLLFSSWKRSQENPGYWDPSVTV